MAWKLTLFVKYFIKTGTCNFDVTRQTSDLYPGPLYVLCGRDTEEAKKIH